MASDIMRTQPQGIRSHPCRARRVAPIERLEQRTLLAGATFAIPVVTQIASGVFPVTDTAVGDLNGDGLPDLVVDRDNLQAQVYLGTTTGNFIPGAIYGTGGDVIALGAFTNSGNLDLAATNGIFPGNGDGTFGPVISGFTLPAGTVQMYAEDTTSDGNVDLVCATYSAATGSSQNPMPSIGISVLLGNGNGTFKPAVTTTVATDANLTQADAVLAFGNFTSSGNLDVMTPFGLMTGNGDGTFNPPLSLLFGNLPGGTQSVPASPILAVGDFTGNGNLDVATIPATGNTGQVEIFLGNGNGTFTDAGPVTVLANDAITALATGTLDTSGNTDLIAGVTSAPGDQNAVSDVAVMVNSGNATFAPPTLYPVAGPPNQISAVDLNDDSNTDLLSIDGIAGNTTATGLSLSDAAVALLNSQVALTTPLLTLHTSANPTIAGDSVKYVALVQPPATAASGAAVPTGTVTFMNGSNVLGTESLVNGKASLTTTASGVGAESITFTYSGDVNYAGAASSTLVQTVLETGAKVPLLLPTLNPDITLPAIFIKGDSGNATVTLTNGGGSAANGKIDVNFYLSASGAIDSSAIALPVPALDNHEVHIGSGKSVALTAHLKLGSYPPGNYFLVAQAVPVTNLTTDDISSTPVVSTTEFQAAGLVFGSVGTHHGLTLKVADANGVVGTFTLTGPGAGTITQSNGMTDLTVTGTTTGSRVNIASHGAFTLDNADVQNMLNTFAAGRTTLAGDLNLDGGVKQLTLASANSATGATIRLGTGAFQPTLSLGNVGDLTLTSSGEIATLSAKSWQSGAIDAPSIANLNIAGTFGADIRTHDGGKLNSARLGAITGGAWAIAGGIGTLHVVGSVDSANIYAGADTGPDDVLGTADDIYAAASIATLFIGSSDTSTLIAAGAAPAPGQTITTSLTLLPKGSIASITLRGVVSPGSRFLAAHLPKVVKLNGAKVLTANDPHFMA